MHGSPLSKYNNRNLWDLYDYHTYGITGEAFLSFEQDNEELHYVTDTGRTWSGKQSLRDVIRTHPGTDTPVSLDTTDDLMAWIAGGSTPKLYLTVHPERWSLTYGEWLLWSFLDFGMNVGKKGLRLMHP